MKDQACCDGCGCNADRPADALDQRTSNPVTWPAWSEALPKLPTLEGNKKP